MATTTTSNNIKAGNGSPSIKKVKISKNVSRSVNTDSFKTQSGPRGKSGNGS